METLAEITEYSDKSCINSFREGAPILGPLPSSGRGKARIKAKKCDSIHDLLASKKKVNEKALSRMIEDKNCEVLKKKTMQDAEAGRMSHPEPLRHTPDDVLIASRFGVEQGVTDTGDVKVRPVDDFTASGVNGCSTLEEKLTNDGIDALFQVARDFAEKVEGPHCLIKADIDAAYRRVPLKAADRWAAVIAFKADGQWLQSEHWAMPFGAVGSVVAWDRIGAMIAHIAATLLHLPILRYVDDYFTCLQEECSGHGLACFAELVRLMLGDTAISVKKLGVGNPLDILGLDVELNYPLKA